MLLVATLAISTLGYSNVVPFRIAKGEIANLPARWDAGWYLGIARTGYEYDRRARGQQNVVFFPAYPLLMRTAGIFLGGHIDDRSRVEMRWRTCSGAACSSILSLWRPRSATCIEWFVPSRTVTPRSRRCGWCSPIPLRSSTTPRTPKDCSYSDRSPPSTTSDDINSSRPRSGEQSSVSLDRTDSSSPRPSWRSPWRARARFQPRTMAGPAQYPTDLPRHLWRDLAVAVAPVAGLMLYCGYLYCDVGRCVPLGAPAGRLGPNLRGP